MRWPRALGWGAAIAAGALAVVGLLSLEAPAPAAPSGTAVAAGGSAFPGSSGPAASAPAQAAASSPALPPAASRVIEDTPPGVSRDQWAALRQDMAQRADGPAELHRLADYFAFQDAVQRLRSLRQSQPDAPELKTLAQQIEQGLPVHLQRNELSAPEAQLIEIAALQVLQPDDAARQQALAQWRQQQARQSAAESGSLAAASTDFEREQARIVAAWRALPAGRRDPALLQQQLQALRERSFPSH